MAVTGEDPATGSAPQRPRARFGPDLKPRVAAAVAMGSVALAAAWIGGFVFAAFWWLASIVVLWEWQRLVGGARLVERVAVGGLALALAALLALHNSILGVVAALVLGAAAVGWLAGRGQAALGGGGRALRRRAGRQRRAAQGQPELRPGRDSVALRGRLGSGHRGLFRRTADRRPAALAERLAGQDLVRGDRRRVRRGRPRPPARGVDEPPRGAVLARARDGDCLRAWRSCSNPRSSGVSASRIRAASFPATAD